MQPDTSGNWKLYTVRWIFNGAKEYNEQVFANSEDEARNRFWKRREENAEKFGNMALRENVEIIAIT